MKVVICYYSGSGNTKLACEYLQRNITVGEVELFDIVHDSDFNPDIYDVVGFAAFADFIGAPQKFLSFVNSLKSENNKPSFLFNTYGFFSGKTILHMEKVIKKKGFTVLGGFSLHTPENYPPMRKKGKDYNTAPNTKEFEELKRFVSELNESIRSTKERELISHKIKVNPLIKLLPIPSRKMAKKDFGIQELKTERCAGCGLCAKGCPYDAIVMNPKPVFNHDKCHGCWFCYNICNSKAVFTSNFKGEFQYPRPIRALKYKLS